MRNTLLALVCALSVWSVCPQALAETKRPRIVNGTAADATQYPWFVTVVSDGGECGGSLIHARWVLTAGHCVTPGQPVSTVRVITGRQKLSATETGQELTALRFYIHPDYDDYTSDNDIALIELAEDVNGAVVKLAAPALPVAPGTTARAVGHGGLAAPMDYLVDHYSLRTDCNYDFASCILEVKLQGVSETEIVTTLLLANGLGNPTQGIGYRELWTQSQIGGVTQPTVAQLVAAYKSAGKGLLDMAEIILEAAAGSDELREVALPIIADKTCSDSTGFSLTKNMLCAGYKGTPKDTCQGDSGGPLVVRNSQDSDWWQVGVVSYGGACATNYGVYTKVSNYLDWIEQHVPNFVYERLFAWGEATAAAALKPLGNERSQTASLPPATYYARLYPGSDTALGVDIATRVLYFYDGKLSSLNAADGWIAQAKAAGY